jgi:hypothetical protein
MHPTLLLALLLLPGCCLPFGPKDNGDTESDTDTDTDTDSDTDADGCDARFTLTLPDGSVAPLDCTGFDADATYEFDPDTAPEVRTLHLELSSAESDGFECHVALSVTGVCGPGWYAVGDGATETVATADCTGVGDADEGTFTMEEGSVQLTTVSGGTEHGNFTGKPVPLQAEGTFVGAGGGLSVEGTFAISTRIPGVDAEESTCSVLDSDPSLDDEDLDGYDNPAAGGEDCDDTDPDVYPGAYDLPDDGIDGDCDGSDRSFDGVVVVEGGTTTEDYDQASAGGAGLDIALLLDTTCSMTSFLNSLDVAAIAAGTTDAVGDARYSFSTFADYYFTDMGVSGDLPFVPVVQMTSDLSDVQSGIDGTSLANGGDEPEAGMEALYQALAGAGYDQDCDGHLDSGTDVRPFVASSGDVFRGSATGTYDSGVVGTGTLGGVGFRGDGVPVVVLITDTYLRDPDSSNATYNDAPGGCDDAGAREVEAAAQALGAWIVGIDVGTDALPEMQLRALAQANGTLVDTLGDGSADDAPEYVATARTLNTVIATAIEDVAAVAGATGYDEVDIVVSSDPRGVVVSVTPDSFTDVAADDTLTFQVEYQGVTTGGRAIDTTVQLSFYGDGELFDTLEIPVEVAPR